MKAKQLLLMETDQLHQTFKPPTAIHTTVSAEQHKSRTAALQVAGSKLDPVSGGGSLGRS